MQEYSEFEAIPDRFDYLIEFQPEIPPSPHTDEQHQDIDAWGDRFDELMERADGHSG